MTRTLDGGLLAKLEHVAALRPPAADAVLRAKWMLGCCCQTLLQSGQQRYYHGPRQIRRHVHLLHETFYGRHSSLLMHAVDCRLPVYLNLCRGTACSQACIHGNNTEDHNERRVMHAVLQCFPTASHKRWLLWLRQLICLHICTQSL